MNAYWNVFVGAFVLMLISSLVTMLFQSERTVSGKRVAVAAAACTLFWFAIILIDNAVLLVSVLWKCFK